MAKLLPATATNAPRRRHRWRFSLRVLLLVIVPSCAAAAALARHTLNVRERCGVWSELYAADIHLSLSEFEVDTPSEFWRLEWWGHDVLADIDHVAFNGTEYHIGLLEHLPNLNGLSIFSSDFEITATNVEDVHRYCPKLNKLYLSDIELDKEARQGLTTFKHLRDLQITRVPIDDDDLHAISNGLTLDVLSVENCREVTDAGLLHLARQTSIKELYLERLSITDEGLSAVAAMPHLEVLHVSNTDVTDDFLRHLARSKNLERLQLPDTKVQGLGLKHLAELPKLSALNLSNAPLTPACFEYLGRLIHLREIRLDNTTVDDHVLRALAACDELETLCLNRTRITDEGMRIVADFPKLQNLRVEYTALTDTGLRHLERIRNARSISCESTYTSAEAMNRLAESFKEIASYWTTDVYDAATGERLFNVPHMPGSISNNGLAVTAHAGRYPEREAHLFQLEPATPIECFERDFNSAAISSSGELVVLTSGGKVHLFDVATKKQVALFIAPTHVDSVSLWQDRLLATMASSDLQVWDLESGKLMHEKIEPRGYGLRFSPDGTKLMVGSTGHPELENTFNDMPQLPTLIYGLTDESRKEPRRVLPYAVDTIFNKQSELIVLDPVKESLVVRNADTNESLCQLDACWKEAILSPDGSLVALANEPSDSLRVYDVATGNLKWEKKLAWMAELSALRFTPDGERLLVHRGPQLMTNHSQH